MLSEQPLYSLLYIRVKQGTNPIHRRRKFRSSSMVDSISTKDNTRRFDMHLKGRGFIVSGMIKHLVKEHLTPKPDRQLVRCLYATIVFPSPGFLLAKLNINIRVGPTLYSRKGNFDQLEIQAT